MIARPHPPALPHGEIREVLPDVFFVTGTMKMPGPLPVTFSRNMTIVREGGRLVLVNSVRLTDAGLAALDALGKVTDVVRLAGFHGMDDPFYAERYGARVWALKGQRYVSGFDPSGPEYFTAQTAMEKDAMPIEGASLYAIGARVPEGLLVLPKHGGIVVSGDSLQNWASTDAYFSLMGGGMMRLGGFIKPHNVGPAWFKNGKPPLAEMRGILDLEFANLMPAHGSPVIGGARDAYRPAIDRVAPAG
jgi:hypothetical protein